MLLYLLYIVNLQVRLDKSVAFQLYLRDTLKSKKWPWLNRKNANISTTTLKIIRSKYNSEWLNNQKDISISFQKLEGLTESIKNETILNLISNFTKINWKVKKILVFPAICVGGAVFKRKIFLSFEEDYFNYYLSMLIHELIHFNTDSDFQKIHRELKFPNDSNEITTVLLTNKLLVFLNKSVIKKHAMQKFSIDQYKELAGHIKALNRIGKVNNDFKKLILAVDLYLSNHKYKGYYKKYGL